MKLTKKFPVKNVVLGLLGVVALDMMLRTLSSASRSDTPPIFSGGNNRSMQQSQNVIELEPVREGDSIVYQPIETPAQIARCDPQSPRAGIVFYKKLL